MLHAALRLTSGTWVLTLPNSSVIRFTSAWRIAIVPLLRLIAVADDHLPRQPADAAQPI
jgi:hypothetical protein